MSKQKQKADASGMMDAVALEFAERYFDSLRYVADGNKWYEWSGVHWRKERTLKAWDYARKMLRDSNDDAAKASAENVNGVVSLARADRVLAATPDQWDCDPWLLGTPKGTVDLRDGKLRKADPDDFITKLAATAPDSKCPTPRWTEFLKDITDGDVEFQEYLQRVFGYCLTGDVREDKLFYGWGEGGNGKGVLLHTIANVMGDYHTTAPTEMFVVSKHGEHDRHPTEKALLRGARLVTATEINEEQQWNKALISKLTGRDPIAARGMRQDFYNYLPTFKLWIIGNHKPKITTVDQAFRRRMNLVPFLVVIAKPDLLLEEKLKPEWPGILWWLIEGCLEWQRIGLNTPEAVIEATQEYLQAEDVIGRWLEDCCVTGKRLFETSAAAWKSYDNWADRCGESAGSRTRFGRKLGERPGFSHDRENGERGFRGLKVRRSEIMIKLRESGDKVGKRQ